MKVSICKKCKSYSQDEEDFSLKALKGLWTVEGVYE